VTIVISNVAYSIFIRSLLQSIELSRQVEKYLWKCGIDHKNKNSTT
jgi:hypothetical protein